MRSSSRPRSRQTVVKQLTNAELLDLVKRHKANVISIPSAQPEAPDVEAQGEDARSQPASASSIHLPQSPLIDSRLVAARNRHRAEKPRPGKDILPFQLKLLKNPYAQALSTPPRACLVTSLRLPSFFQIPFGLATHPKTGAPWHLPRLSIESMPEPNSERNQEPSVDESQHSGRSGALERPPSRVVSGTHFLGSRHIFQYVSAMHNNTYRKIMPYRWKEDSTIKVPDIVWREDMDTFVLEMMRKSVAKKLAYLASRSAAYIAASENYEAISKQNQVAAVLWLGPYGKDSALDASSNVGANDSGPPPYAMYHYRSHYIPCYNLATLLGPLHLCPLRNSEPPHFAGQYAIIKLKRGTVDVQLELWKLLGYLANENKDKGTTGSLETDEIGQEGVLEEGENSGYHDENGKEVS